MISGSLGAPDAAASALTMRSIDASTFARTRSSKVRTLSPSIASVGDDVVLGAGVELPDGDHRGIRRRDFPRDDALQPHRGRRGEVDGVDRRLGTRSVPARAVELDRERVGGRPSRRPACTAA